MWTHCKCDLLSRSPHAHVIDMLLRDEEVYEEDKGDANEDGLHEGEFKEYRSVL